MERFSLPLFSLKVRTSYILMLKYFLFCISHQVNALEEDMDEVEESSDEEMELEVIR